MKERKRKRIQQLEEQLNPICEEILKQSTSCKEAEQKLLTIYEEAYQQLLDEFGRR